MKVWNSFGSEHSADLVIIGEFRDAETAKEVTDLLDQVQEIVIQDGVPLAELRKQVYKECGLGDFGDTDVESMTLCHTWQQQGKHVRVTTDETDIQGILKIMLNKRGRIEVYSNGRRN
jgi:rRNA maturation endonuclease Nob1